MRVESHLLPLLVLSVQSGQQKPKGQSNGSYSLRLGDVRFRLENEHLALFWPFLVYPAIAPLMVEVPNA